MMLLPIWIHNFFAGIRIRLTEEPYLRNADGRLVPVDDWEGYEICMRPGCGHYRCEHSFGETWTTLYVKPDTEIADSMGNVGDKISYPVGCLNAGCECQGFWKVLDLVAYINTLTYARKDSAYALRQVPGVTHVESGISIAVWADTYTKNRDESAWDAIYAAEKLQHDKHPNVLFDFNTRWDKSPED